MGDDCSARSLYCDALINFLHTAADTSNHITHITDTHIKHTHNKHTHNTHITNTHTHNTHTYRKGCCALLTLPWALLLTALHANRCT